MFRILPPPSPGTSMLAGGYRTGARCATDGPVTQGIESADRDSTFPGIIKNLLLAPFQERVDLEYPAICLIQLYRSKTGPGYALFAAQSGYPSCQPPQRPAKRFNLANAAALMTVVQ
jgi:hypothetical protein